MNNVLINTGLIWNDYVTHMHVIAVYVMEECPFRKDLTLEYSKDSCLHFQLVLLYSVSYFFFLYQ